VGPFCGLQLRVRNYERERAGLFVMRLELTHHVIDNRGSGDADQIRAAYEKQLQAGQRLPLELDAPGRPSLQSLAITSGLPSAIE
jgi:hypothetical protein